MAGLFDGVNPSAIHFNCSDPGSVVNNYFNLTEFACFSSYFNGSHPLPNYVGYLTIFVLGTLFGVICLGITTFDYRTLGTQDTSEHYISAGRSIKVGLTATDM